MEIMARSSTVERSPHKTRVVGSNPTGPTNHNLKPNFLIETSIEMLMTIYFILMTVWLLYIGIRTYSPQAKRGLREKELSAPYYISRPYFVGFLITNTVLMPFAIVLSAVGGVLNDDIKKLFRRSV